MLSRLAVQVTRYSCNPLDTILECTEFGLQIRELNYPLYFNKATPGWKYRYCENLLLSCLIARKSVGAFAASGDGVISIAIFILDAVSDYFNRVLFRRRKIWDPCSTPTFTRILQIK